jgi:hypothetical protein
MKKVIVWLFRSSALSLCLLLSACVFINSGSIGESSGGGTAVAAEYSDYGILHLTAPANLTSNASAALASKCQSGMLSDVQTELSTRDWLLIVQYYTVTTAGVCK